MTPEERKAIIHRPWTFEEARAASATLKALSSTGEWDEYGPTCAMTELATALSSHPAHIVSFVQVKIIEAYEARMGINQTESYTFTLDGSAPEPLELGKFLVDNNPDDDVAAALYALSPGESYTHTDGWVITRVR